MKLIKTFSGYANADHVIAVESLGNYTLDLHLTGGRTSRSSCDMFNRALSRLSREELLPNTIADAFVLEAYGGSKSGKWGVQRHHVIGWRRDGKYGWLPLTPTTMDMILDDPVALSIGGMIYVYDPHAGCSRFDSEAEWLASLPVREAV